MSFAHGASRTGTYITAGQAVTTALATARTMKTTTKGAVAMNDEAGGQAGNNNVVTASTPTASVPVATSPDTVEGRIFEIVREKLRAKLGQDAFRSWFSRVELEEATPSVVRLSVPTLFLRSWITERYLDQLTAFWLEEQPTVLRVELVVRSATRRPVVNSAAKSARQAAASSAVSAAAQTSARKGEATGIARSAATPFPTDARGRSAASGNKAVDGSAIDPRYTFDAFVEGPSNRVPIAAAKAVVEGNANTARFNPLFFYSSVGLGKTHLLQAIANEVKKRDPNKKVIYLTAEYFMHAFASAIQNNNALKLKQSLHEIDLLIIDDMQFLQGEKIQSEFCHLINALLDSARLVVAAADRPPSELESLDRRVRSRLHSGVALEINAPDYDMRLAMLRERLDDAKRDDMTLHLDDAVLEHVAQTVTSSFRELEGAFNQLVFRHSVDPDIRIDRVNDLLHHLVRSDDRKKVRIEDIQRVVANHYEVPRNDLLSNRRTRRIVRPRQVAMYLAKQMTPRSLPEIGRRFGGRDHTTVLHAVRKVEELKSDDPKLAKEIELLRRLIEE